jgi:alkylation response protein AidB-like acyl-CoA dehydrogenase
MTAIPTSPDVFLGRAQAAAALTEAGFPVSAATLSTKATRGGGPAYRLFGQKSLYRWGDALAWAQSRCTRPHTAKAENQPAAVA